MTILSTTANADLFAGFACAATRRARELFLIAALSGLLAGALAADTSASNKEKSLPEGGLIGRMRREEEAKKKQAGSDIKVAIPDVDAAQRELEGLSNTVSNAMRMTEQNRRAEEASGGVFRSVVIGAILLGA